ncbi:hypothetical protein CBR_g37903 [Chara braunii]|uniref:Reverse transcriptase domain-containing protein n=1 Tax=Chara braunii TaxID=69332 RepID=A0A388LNX3_CHABU|nr:hypothetical protein CBR_g37903 [Chara braunii]|eukprot:GBG84027.1 hypothetical protein CBR_g37903 [Chara braunii]
MAQLTSVQWRALLDAASDAEKPYLQALLESAIKREQETEKERKETLLKRQVALLEIVPSLTEEQCGEQLQSILTTLVQIRNLEDHTTQIAEVFAKLQTLQDDLTDMTRKYHELAKEVADLRQAQVANSLPLPPGFETAIETTSAPLIVSSSSNVLATPSEPATRADSAVAVTSNEAGTSATAAAPRSEPAAAGPNYAGPYVDRKAVQMPSKYDGKEDIESWIGSMRAYIEILGTQPETQAVIMGMNVEPTVRGFLEVQATRAGSQCEWTKWKESLFMVKDAQGNELPVLLDEKRESPVTFLKAMQFCKKWRKHKEEEQLYVAFVRPTHVPSTFAANITTTLIDDPTSATFQSLMDKVLREQIGRFVVVYLYDILIFSKSMEEHLKHLEEVLAILKKTQLHLSLEKSEFGKDSVIYLGHRLSVAGLEPEATKIEVIRDWPQPANICELRSFLGLASYYRKFVPRFSIIARLLSRLTSKNVPYSWDAACTEAFQALKEALGCRYFNKIDLKSGYHQIEVAPEDEHKTAFRTRKFVRNFSTIAAPLRKLLRKETIWKWDKDCTSAMKKLKQALIEYPVLKVADPSLPFVVTTDASQYGIGAVLQQDDGNGYRPVEFMSARMPSEKVATSTYERELYALRQALDHWKHYLLGRHFKVYSDHETLRWLKTQAKMISILGGPPR